MQPIIILSKTQKLLHKIHAHCLTRSPYSYSEEHIDQISCPTVFNISIPNVLSTIKNHK